MKILLINNFHFRKGGSETVYFNTAEILQKRGHEVIFFSRENPKNLPCRQAEYFIRSSESTSYLRRMLNYFYNKEARHNIEKLILQEKPDIAHVHLFWGGISPSIFGILRKYKIPLVHTAHDYRMVCPAYVFNSNGRICEECQGVHFYKCALKRCSKKNLVESVLMSAEMYERNRFLNPAKNLSGVIYVSRFSREKHRQYMPLLSSIPSTVLYNFANEPSVDLLNHFSGDYYLFYGRLSSEKGVDKLIDVFASLPDISLKIVGTGPLEEQLKQTVVRRRITNIEFLGYKIGRELQTVVSRASFVLVPPQCYENNPMTIIEAYSLQKPVIGANLGGIPEIIDDGKTGYIFQHDNPEDLHRIIKKTINMSEADYLRMAQNSYEFFKNNFSSENYAVKLEEFYNQIKDSYENI